MKIAPEESALRTGDTENEGQGKQGKQGGRGTIIYRKQQYTENGGIVIVKSSLF